MDDGSKSHRERDWFREIAFSQGEQMPPWRDTNIDEKPQDDPAGLDAFISAWKTAVGDSFTTAVDLNLLEVQYLSRTTN